MPIKYIEGTNEWVFDEEPGEEQNNVVLGNLPLEYIKMPSVKKVSAVSKEDTKDTIIVDGCKLHKDDPRIVTDLVTGNKTIKDNCGKVFTDIKKNEFGYMRMYGKCPLGIHEKLGKIIALNPQVFINAGMSESFVNGLFFSPNQFNNSYCDYRKFDNHCSLIGDDSGETSKTYLLTEGKKYTFGIELEFSKLYIPEYLTYDYNMRCVRDGSLNAKQGGPEIVTGVLIGDSGLNHLQKICIELAKRGTIDEYCGIHVHVGGFDATKEFITLSYLLGIKIEQELSLMLPPTRRKNAYCRSLKTDFTRKTFAKDKRERQIELDEYYLKIQQWLSHYQIQDPKLISRKMNHPMGAKCQYDHSTPRYCWLNLIPTTFNTRGDESYTLEFRNHSGSSNFTKIYNWIKICMAFVHFVENCKERIITQNITLHDIVKEAYPKSWMKLDNYIEERKIKFASDRASSEERREYAEGCENQKSIKELLCV